MAAILLSIIVLAGAAGLYMLMPGARLSFWQGAGLLLTAATAGFLAFGTRHIPDRGLAIWFAAFAIIGLLGAIRVITSKQPVYSALFFILVALCVTGLLVLMNAEFLAAGLLAIYAGAILVTYVFVIMLAQQSGTSAYDHAARQPFLGVIAGFLLLGAIIGALTSSPLPGSAADATSAELAEFGRGTVENIGIQLMTTYAVAIQIAGVLLLSSMVGAIAIARRRAVADDPMMQFGEAD